MKLDMVFSLRLETSFPAVLDRMPSNRAGAPASGEVANFLMRPEKKINIALHRCSRHLTDSFLPMEITKEFK